VLLLQPARYCSFSSSVDVGRHSLLPRIHDCESIMLNTQTGHLLREFDLPDGGEFGPDRRSSPTHPPDRVNGESFRALRDDDEE
jgi:hypothetical protein